MSRAIEREFTLPGDQCAILVQATYYPTVRTGALEPPEPEYVDIERMTTVDGYELTRTPRLVERLEHRVLLWVQAGGFENDPEAE